MTVNRMPASPCAPKSAGNLCGGWTNLSILGDRRTAGGARLWRHSFAGTEKSSGSGTAKSSGTANRKTARTKDAEPSPAAVSLRERARRRVAR